MKKNTTMERDLKKSNGKGDASIWQTLANRGVIAELKIGRPRFEEQLDLAELGIKPRNAKESASLQAQVRAGTKLLLPPRYSRHFFSIESSARHTLYRKTSAPNLGFIYAFSTPLGSFVPADSYDAWIAKVTDYRAQYKEVAEDLLENYNAVKTEVLREYANIADGTWRRLKAAAPNTTMPTQDAFTKAFITSIRNAFPSKDALAWCDDHATHDAQHTYFEWRLRHIAMPDDMRKTLVAETLKTEAERERQKTLLEMAEKARQSSLKELEGFGIALNRQLYTLLFEVAERAHESISGADHTPSKTLNQLTGLVKQVRALNPMDNAEVVKWAERLASTAKGYETKNKDELLVALDVVRTAASERLSQYGEVRRVRRRDDDEIRVVVEDAPRRERHIA